MAYYKKLNINGTEYPIAVNITGQGTPSELTEAEVGMLYMDTDTGEMYKRTPDGWIEIPESLVDYVVGINKFNPDTLKYDFALDSTGGLYAYKDGVVTDFIPCYDKTVFSCTNPIIGIYCVYGKNKEKLEHYAPSSRYGQPIPKGAYYLRVVMGKANVEGQMIIFAETTDGVPYEPYKDTKVLKSDIKITLDNLDDDVKAFFDITEKLDSFSEEFKNNFFGEKIEGINRYNKNTAVENCTLGTQGEPVEYDGRVTSDFIPCYGKTVFSCSNSIIAKCYFYDKNKKYISSHSPANKYGIPIPDDTYYLRIIMSESNAKTQMVIFADTASGIPYEAYTSKDSLNSNILITDKNLEAVKHLFPSDFSLHTELFNGCTIKLIGDSITHGVGGTGFTNDAENGELIMSVGDNSFYTNPNGYCWANLFKNYLEEKFSNVTVHANGTRGESYHSFQLNNFSRLKQLVTASDDTDIVILMFGTNDRNYCTDIPDMITKASAVIEYITKTCGKTLILMTSIPASVANETGASIKFHMEDVANVNKYLADKYKLPFVDIYTEFIYRIAAKGEEINTYLSDGLHPNDNGYKLMFDIIADKLGIALKRSDATW